MIKQEGRLPNCGGNQYLCINIVLFNKDEVRRIDNFYYKL